MAFSAILHGGQGYWLKWVGLNACCLTAEHWLLKHAPWYRRPTRLVQCINHTMVAVVQVLLPLPILDSKSEEQ